jgi:hypothetical protein
MENSKRLLEKIICSTDVPLDDYYEDLEIPRATTLRELTEWSVKRNLLFKLSNRLLLDGNNVDVKINICSGWIDKDVDSLCKTFEVTAEIYVKEEKMG